MENDDASSSEVLIVAPTGKDAALAADVLGKADIRSRICRTLTEAARQMGELTDALLIAEESLVASEVLVLLDTLDQQPPWSDIPLVILTSSGGGDKVSLRALEIFGPRANITLLERPLRTVTLASSMKVALRARRRQREVRDLIRERETVLAGISDAFSALDRQWRYTYVNEKVAELAGWPREKMIGRVIWEIFPEAIGGEFHKQAQRVMQTGEPSHGEFYYLPWKRWLDTRIYPTKDGIIIFRADITEQKKHEELAREREAKLAESQDRLRLATEAADIGTFDFFPKTGEVQFSDRSRELFGIPLEAQITYDTYLAGVHPDDRHIVHEMVRSVKQPGSTGRFDIEYRTI
ncbi:MAG: hypothetical protein DMF06_15945, partial [Verrucomicrobia bacterium]